MNRFNAEDIKKEIESFKAELSFPNFKPPDNINKIISDLSILENMRKLTPLDMAEYAVLLTNYSLFLTTQENRVGSYINWLESNIKFIVGNNLDSAFGYGFNEKDHYIRAKDTNAQDLEQKKLAAQAQFDQLKNLSFKIQMLSDSLENLIKEKRKYEYR